MTFFIMWLYAIAVHQTCVTTSGSIGLLNRAQAYLDPLAPSGNIPGSGCTVQYLESSSLALTLLLLLLAARLPLLHAEFVDVRMVYTHLGILVVDDISHNVVTHSGDGEIPRGISLLRELPQTGIGSPQSIDRVEILLGNDCSKELLELASLLT